jgi:hypothetical protein
MAQKTVQPELVQTKLDDVAVPEPKRDAPELAEHEKWLYENPEALASVKRGLADIAAGRVHRMSFTEHLDISIDEDDADA